MQAQKAECDARMCKNETSAMQQISQFRSVSISAGAIQNLPVGFECVSVETARVSSGDAGAFLRNSVGERYPSAECSRSCVVRRNPVSEGLNRGTRQTLSFWANGSSKSAADL